MKLICLFYLVRFFSQKPHVAGSPEQLELANYLASKWREYEFDEVETIEYKVLLSYPMENNPNVVSIVENGTIVEEMKQSMEVRAQSLVNSYSFIQLITFFLEGSNTFATRKRKTKQNKKTAQGVSSFV